LAAGFCPKNLPFAHKMGLPESGELQVWEGGLCSSPCPMALTPMVCCVASAQQVTERSVDNSHNIRLEDVSSDGEFNYYFFTFWIFSINTYLLINLNVNCPITLIFGTLITQSMCHWTVLSVCPSHLFTASVLSWETVETWKL